MRGERVYQVESHNLPRGMLKNETGIDTFIIAFKARTQSASNPCLAPDKTLLPFTENNPPSLTSCLNIRLSGVRVKLRLVQRFRQFECQTCSCCAGSTIVYPEVSPSEYFRKVCIGLQP